MASPVQYGPQTMPIMTGVNATENLLSNPKSIASFIAINKI